MVTNVDYVHVICTIFRILKVTINQIHMYLYLSYLYFSLLAVSSSPLAMEMTSSTTIAAMSPMLQRLLEYTEVPKDMHSPIIDHCFLVNNVIITSVLRYLPYNITSSSSRLNHAHLSLVVFHEVWMKFLVLSA